MTIYAAAVRDCEAILWTDTESYIDGEVYETTSSKLGIFPASGIISFGNGRIFLGQSARQAVEGCSSLDDAVKKMPAVLSSASTSLFDRCRALNMDTTVDSTICLLGFLRAFKSLMIVEFCSATGSRYKFRRQVSSPEVDVDIDPLADDWEVIDLARQQLERLRAAMPNATGASLIIARLAGETITIKKINNFAISPCRGSPNSAWRNAGAVSACAAPAHFFEKEG